MDVKKYKKDELLDVAKTLSSESIKELVEYLWESDDKIRYPSFLILKFRSEINDDVYPYWNNFVEMFKSDNAYFRTIGLGLISINAKWDKDNKFNEIIDEYLSFCEDEKLMTARLCIQGLHDVINGIKVNKNIYDKIVEKLVSIDIFERPETNWKVMITDIINILIEIQKKVHYDKISTYLNQCLNKDIIDKKLKKNIEEILN